MVRSLEPYAEPKLVTINGRRTSALAVVARRVRKDGRGPLNPLVVRGRGTITKAAQSKHQRWYLRERISAPLLAYAFWDPAGLRSSGLWDRDEEPDDVLSSGLVPSAGGPAGGQGERRRGQATSNTLSVFEDLHNQGMDVLMQCEGFRKETYPFNGSLKSL